ncbi:MAG TPA: isocitrate lyase/phosphoenolpyruvate mutase family protein [Ktedonobacterales bacterium]|nr:isocitrate lyase/phosphoenolpyruvate mutase family protein [Ktedonobacterales bacterium]
MRQWHQQQPILLLPNAWDAASARIFARLGFRAIATTSSGVAIANGYPDGEQIPRALMIETTRRIVAAVDCPVTADIEAGYGDGLDEKLDTIKQVVAAGAVGVNIEDSLAHGAPALVSQTAQVELIKAIRAAASEWGVPLVINARTDVYLYDAGDAASRLAEATERGNAYLAAGADCVFPIGASDAETIAALARGVNGPINILASPRTPTIPELASLGVARVSFGGGLASVALGAARRAAQELLQQGTFTSMAQDALPSGDFRGLFGK